EGDGVLTYKEAALVQPFANTLVTTVLTGAQLEQVLEEQWQPETASRPFLRLGVSEGLTYTYDPDAPAGEHISQRMRNGQPAPGGPRGVGARGAAPAADGPPPVPAARGLRGSDPHLRPGCPRG